MTLRLLDTFSGIGGFSYAAERLVGGYRTVAFVEREPFCQSILRKHWPDVPIHDDITTFQPEPHSADVVCGGFPCQDISTAGKQAGIKHGTRSGLFYELMRVVRLVGPRYVVLENVAAITSNGLDTVLGTLAEAGFDAEWACIPASDVGACHRRDRWWCVAYAQGWRRGARQDKARARPDTKGRELATVVRDQMLPTPRTCSAMAARLDTPGNLESERFPNLETVVAREMLPTPRAGETADRTSTPGNRFSLSAWASRGCSTLPTPTTNDSKNASLPPSQQKRDGLAGAMLRDDSIPTGATTYLNPSFVEEMMGFPIGWTA